MTSLRSRHFFVYDKRHILIFLRDITRLINYNVKKQHFCVQIHFNEPGYLTSKLVSQNKVDFELTVAALGLFYELLKSSVEIE